VIPEDLKDFLDPLKLRKKIGPIIDLPEVVRALLRILTETLKAVHETNDELKKMRSEIESMRQELSELKDLLGK